MNAERSFYGTSHTGTVTTNSTTRPPFEDHRVSTSFSWTFCSRRQNCWRDTEFNCSKTKITFWAGNNFALFDFHFSQKLDRINRQRTTLHVFTRIMRDAFFVRADVTTNFVPLGNACIAQVVWRLARTLINAVPGSYTCVLSAKSEVTSRSTEVQNVDKFDDLQLAGWPAIIILTWTSR